MKHARFALVPLLGLALVAPAFAAEESGYFVTRLGDDTTAVEHYVRTPERLVIDQVGRSPRVLERHFAYEYAKGDLARLAVTVRAPGAQAPVQSIEGTRDADSLRLSIQTGKAPATKLNVALQRGALVVAGSCPWSGYETLIARLMKEKGDSLRTSMYMLGYPAANWVSLHRVGRDSVSVVTEHEDVFHARIDRAGRVLGVLPIAGTAKFGATRVASLDLDALAAAFAAREKSGAGLGVLSPRDTVKVESAGGASLWIDYGRPGKRGREIFGNVVPYGEVWRTGANAATQFRTDKALDFGGTVVPAGFYTLWTLPKADGWTLIVNGETGQWGTEHKPEKDLYTIDLQVSRLPQPEERFTISVEPDAQGGVLHLDWDTTRASAAFTVKP